MRTKLQSLLNLRHSPDLRIRAVWWGIAALLAVATLAEPTLRSLALTLWIVANMAIFAGASVWAVFHPRTALFVSRAARWAFWITLISFLASYAGLDIVVAEFVYQIPGSISALIPLFAIALIPFLFALYWFLGGVGAAIACMARKTYVERAAPPKTGVASWWTTSVLTLLLTIALTAVESPTLLTAAVMTGTPVYSLLCARWFLKPGRAPERLKLYVSALLSRKLVWKRKDAVPSLTIDFRGAALGLTSGLMALILGAMNFFAPFQTSTLATYIRFKNALSSRIQIFEPESGRTSGITESPVVLLEMDDAIRYAALTNRSESDVQAQAIRKLSEYGVKRIVLPSPLLDKSAGALPRYARKGPLPDSAEVDRSIRDVKMLTDAMQKAANVVLALPQQHQHGNVHIFDDAPATPLTPEAKKLRDEYYVRLGGIRKAAVSVGISDLHAFGTPSLTAVKTDFPNDPEVPLLLLAAHRDKSLQIVHSKRREGHVLVAGRSLRTVAPDTILVAGSEPTGDNDLPRVSYAALEHDEPIFTGQSVSESGKEPAKLKDRWSRPSRYFRDKIVFLEPISWEPRDTPSGVVSRTEVLAGATAALISGKVVEARDNWKDVVLILLLPAFIGHICARRDPFDSMLPVVVACFVVFAVSIYIFMEHRLFIDPVLPVFASVCALIISTQFTFAQERAARNRNRALLQRFVAPQFVEEMLDDPEGKLGLGGRRTDICVIFADIRNFTQFAESHSPEEVVESVNAYMTAMTDSLHAFGGILDKYTGDGLMALFLLSGDPRAGLAQAVNAALSMRDAAARVSAEMTAQGHAPLDVGIGLHYGPAIVGIVGNPIHQVNYTALGETVVISARLQTLAAGGEVVISQAIYDLLSGAFHVQPGEPVHVKGIASMIRPYRVLGLENTPIPATFIE